MKIEKGTQETKKQSSLPTTTEVFYLLRDSIATMLSHLILIMALMNKFLRQDNFQTHIHAHHRTHAILEDKHMCMCA